MSSTNRSDARDRSGFDYYRTPITPIIEFLRKFKEVEPNAITGNSTILDPCAGGDANNPMSYPTALMSVFDNPVIDTIDIREDSHAEVIQNYLDYDVGLKYNLIITNPPFNQIMPVIEKAFDDVKTGGWVIMLLRLNFFGGQLRRAFWENNMPRYTFVHNKRMSFTENKKTDSIEYAHFCWQKGTSQDYTKLYVI